MRTRSAFTLIELLVMIAVSAIVALHSLGASFTATMLPESSGALPSRTTVKGDDGKSYTSLTNLIGPLTGISCLIKGYQVGGSTQAVNGSYLIYRMRLDFDEEVTFNSFSTSGLGANRTGSVVRVLSPTGVVLASAPMTGFNIPFTATVSAGVRGTSFIIDEFDQSTNFRFRQSMVVSFTPTGAPVLTIAWHAPSIAVSWLAASNAQYQAQFATQISPTNWTDIGSIFQGDGGSKVLTDSVMDRERGFYRVVRLP